MLARAAAIVVLAGACTGPVASPTAAGPAITFGDSTPEAEGLDRRVLLELAEAIRDHPSWPIYSLLISRNGKLVFELYTSGTTRADADYVMSVTKSFTSALIGIAIGAKLLTGADETVTAALPAALFASDADRARFATVTIRDVLGMSALDAPVPPHDKSAEAAAREQAFLSADNRLRFALGQRLLPTIGTSYLYTDITPILATGMIEYTAHQTELEFAEQHLFGPLGFEHYEWMGEDPAGIDNGAYGLRVRPLDMQKLGVLYLARGMWNGVPIIPASWVDTSFTPWIRSKPAIPEPNYGWYWWTLRYGTGWTVRAALGWKGQCILVVPEQQLVVTLTGYVEGGGEDALRDRLFEDFVMPAVMHGAGAPDPAIAATLAQVLAQVQAGPRRGPPNPEPRMIPSAAAKLKHHALRPE